MYDYKIGLVLLERIHFLVVKNVIMLTSLEKLIDNTGAF